MVASIPFVMLHDASYKLLGTIRHIFLTSGATGLFGTDIGNEKSHGYRVVCS